MFDTIRKTLALGAIVASVATFTSHPAQAIDSQAPRHVDLAIALDVSGSMDGLIESAKQRLWDIANELARAEPQPELRVAILSYGNPDYGLHTGYVSVDQPFTRDLDAVNKTLFAFGTNGGDEYVARAVHTSVSQLQWSDQPDALRIIFVAGNESAEQDPQILIEQASQMAIDRDIFVNTIYCGNDAPSVTTGWQKVAALTRGMYATIDQNVAALANIATPMDEALAVLNEELNQTYLAFGRDGTRFRDNQHAQDENAEQMSRAAAASRAITKASVLYNSAHWDLIDAMEAGQTLEELDETELPQEMRAMSEDERQAYVNTKAQRRAELQQRIGELDKKRRAYVAEKQKQTRGSGAKGLDEVIRDGLRSLAEKKGFSFEES